MAKAKGTAACATPARHANGRFVAKATAASGAPQFRMRPTAAQQSDFLAHLAETANVAASVRATGLHSFNVYRERIRNARFAARWHEALCQGYVRLETAMLGEALVAASANTGDAKLKAQALKDRTRLALLSHHRATVKGEAPQAGPKSRHAVSPRRRLEARLAQMHERMAKAGLC